jgi:hypothetical protein
MSGNKLSGVRLFEHGGKSRSNRKAILLSDISGYAAISLPSDNCLLPVDAGFAGIFLALPRPGAPILRGYPISLFGLKGVSLSALCLE